MKRIILVIAISILTINSAFSEIKLSLGVMSGTKSKIDYKSDASINGGFNTKLKLDIAENVFLSSGFSYYLPYKYNHRGDNYTFYNSVVNADLNYYFLDNGEIVLYGLGGINMDMLSSKSEIDGTEMKSSSSKYDFEFGVGIQIEACYAEIKMDRNKEQIQIFSRIHY